MLVRWDPFEMKQDKEVPKAELFKDKADIFEPGFRWNYDNTNGKYFNFFYDSISKIKLDSSVPTSVLVNFETSKNTLLYSFYCYRMSTPARLYLLCTLEMALTEKAAKIGKIFKDHQGLGEKFSFAFHQEWLDIKQLAPPMARENVKDWLKYTHNDFIGFYVYVRNELAHGSSSLETPLMSCDFFAQVAQIINMLYEERGASTFVERKGQQVSKFKKLVEAVPTFSDVELLSCYSSVLKELKNRKVIRSENVIGDLGEKMAIEFYARTNGLPTLKLSSASSRFVNAVCTNRKRYAIKTITGKTTALFYGLPGPNSKKNLPELFDYLIIVRLNELFELEHILEIEWKTFLEFKQWHKRMKAWNISITEELLVHSTVRIFNCKEKL